MLTSGSCTALQRGDGQGLSILIVLRTQKFLDGWEAVAGFAPDQQLEGRVFVSGFSAAQIGSQRLAHHRSKRALFFQGQPFRPLEQGVIDVYGGP